MTSSRTIAISWDFPGFFKDNKRTSEAEFDLSSMVNFIMGEVEVAIVEANGVSRVIKPTNLHPGTRVSVTSHTGLLVSSDNPSIAAG